MSDSIEMEPLSASGKRYQGEYVGYSPNWKEAYGNVWYYALFILPTFIMMNVGLVWTFVSLMAREYVFPEFNLSAIYATSFLCALGAGAIMLVLALGRISAINVAVRRPDGKKRAKTLRYFTSWTSINGIRSSIILLIVFVLGLAISSGIFFREQKVKINDNLARTMFTKDSEGHYGPKVLYTSALDSTTYDDCGDVVIYHIGAQAYENHLNYVAASGIMIFYVLLQLLINLLSVESRNVITEATDNASITYERIKKRKHGAEAIIETWINFFTDKGALFSIIRDTKRFTKSSSMGFFMWGLRLLALAIAFFWIIDIIGISGLPAAGHTEVDKVFLMLYISFAIFGTIILILGISFIVFLSSDKAADHVSTLFKQKMAYGAIATVLSIIVIISIEWPWLTEVSGIQSTLGFVDHIKCRSYPFYRSYNALMVLVVVLFELTLIPIFETSFCKMESESKQNLVDHITM